MPHRDTTVPVRVGGMTVGGGAPVSVQAMTNTDTSNVAATVAQIMELATAGAELVRITVNTPEAARAVPDIIKRARDGGCVAPIIGDFHYNGHRLLREYPDCAAALDKYRINPGNVGGDATRDARFRDICAVARDLDKTVRIGVNAGSLDQRLVEDGLARNASLPEPVSAETVYNECMVVSALDSTEQALDAGVSENRIILSCKSSRPRDLIAVYRALAGKTRQPLHLGLTEAGLGVKGLVWSAAAMGALLEEGIGDTIRVSLTPAPGGSRCDEVVAAQELLQALALRQYAPTVTACPGCGRTNGDAFQWLAEETEKYIRARLPIWREQHPGVESITVAVMGCIVNGPGESRAADIGISLPGNNENPQCPVFVGGVQAATLTGTREDIRTLFLDMLETYVAARHCVPGDVSPPTT